MKQPALKLPVVGDEIIRFVQRVFLPSGNGVPHSVVFSSLEHEVGCTSVCASAAITIAGQTTARVCAVDANFRKPSLHRYFDLENGPGLSDSLVQAGAIRNLTHRLGDSNLWVLTSGSADFNADALLNSEALPSRIAELRNDFDFVLIDAPPVNLYRDAVALGRGADGIVLVLQLGTTRRELARDLKESMNGHVRLLGAVLNRRKFHIPQSLYEKFF
jgi:capsular exopolysaccharide synthesis family protein